MNNIELLVPAGNLEKLKIAYLYGADAVYIGGKNFSLRANAGNFSISEIKKARIISKKLNKKLYVTLNVFLNNKDIKKIIIYLKKLNEIKVDAIIVSDIGLIYLSKKYAPNLKIHLSTQANTQNFPACIFWEKEGIERVVLGREVNLHSIKNIIKKTNLEIEVFIHGSMCMSYSGRCMLSMYMTDKSANSGKCTHPCRWEYYVVEKKRKNDFMPIEEDKNGTYIFNSKDLCMLPYLEKLINSGIRFFKIEGRMKSIHYIATVTKIYKKAIETIKRGNNFKLILPELTKDLIGISERDYTTGFYFKKPTIFSQQYCLNKINKSIIFVGKVLKKYKNNFIKIEQKNKFSLGDELEVLLPNKNNLNFKVNKIINNLGNEVKNAPHPKEILLINGIKEIEPGSLLRKRR